MTFKSLMVHLELASDNSAVLGVAAELAARFEARVIGIAACQPMMVIDNAGLCAGDALTEDFAEIGRELEAAKAQFHGALEGRAHGLQWRTAITCDALADFLADEARAVDLIISGKDLGTSLLDNTRRVDIGSLAMRAGRPLLLVPREVRSLPLRNVFIGWKEARESRRAVADALPLLREAAQTTVLTITPADQLAHATSHVEDVVSWLGTHGVTAVPQALAMIGTEAAHLRTELLDRKCDLLVAGAYGHSRLREWALGGVTGDLLLDPGFCVLLSH